MGHLTHGLGHPLLIRASSVHWDYSHRLYLLGEGGLFGGCSRVTPGSGLSYHSWWHHPSGVLGIEPAPASLKANVLPAVLSLLTFEPRLIPVIPAPSWSRPLTSPGPIPGTCAGTQRRRRGLGLSKAREGRKFFLLPLKGSDPSSTGEPAVSPDPQAPLPARPPPTSELPGRH